MSDDYLDYEVLETISEGDETIIIVEKTDKAQDNTNESGGKPGEQAKLGLYGNIRKLF